MRKIFKKHYFKNLNTNKNIKMMMKINKISHLLNKIQLFVLYVLLTSQIVFFNPVDIKVINFLIFNKLQQLFIKIIDICENCANDILT